MADFHALIGSVVEGEVASIIYGCNNVNNNNKKTKLSDLIKLSVIKLTVLWVWWWFIWSSCPVFPADLVHTSATSRWFCDFSVLLSIGWLVLKLVSDIWFHSGSRLNILVLLHEASYPLSQLGLVQMVVSGFQAQENKIFSHICLYDIC